MSVLASLAVDFLGNTRYTIDVDNCSKLPKLLRFKSKEEKVRLEQWLCRGFYYHFELSKTDS